MWVSLKFVSEHRIEWIQPMLGTAFIIIRNVKYIDIPRNERTDGQTDGWMNKAMSRYLWKPSQFISDFNSLRKKICIYFESKGRFPLYLSIYKMWYKYNRNCAIIGELMNFNIEYQNSSLWKNTLEVKYNKSEIY